MDDPTDVHAFLAAHPSGHLITVGPDGVPDATLLPYLLDGSGRDGESQRLLVHLARANAHWRRITNGSAGIFVVTGADAYISPSWYASKREHGRVVPTWNYSEVHVHGTVHVHDDPDWLRGVVTGLTDLHEAEREHPWSVTDAPEAYVSGQLRAIVGVELLVERIEGKAKLSQNRSLDDRLGAITGLEAEAATAAHEVAAAMRVVTPEAQARS